MTLLAAAVLGGTVGVTLLEHVPNIIERPLAQGLPRTRVMHVDLGAARRLDGTRVARVGFKVAEVERIVGGDAIRLFLSTYDTDPELVAGEIRIEGSPCVFRSTPGHRIPNNRELTFERQPGCGSPRAGGPPGRLDLELVFRGPGRVGILTALVPARAYNPLWPTFASLDVAGRATVPVLQGHVVERRQGPPRRRIDLLAYMWRGSESTGWIWGVVVIAVLLVCGGGWALAGGVSADSRWPVAAGASVLAALATGLALLYAVLVPPLHGPDEPDHLLAFADAVNRPAVRLDTETLSSRGHFDRIFQASERFRMGDIGHPYPVAWDPRTVFAHDVAARSVTTWVWWKILAPLTPQSDAGGVLLAIRVANGLLFGVLAGAAAALLYVSARDVTTRHPRVVVLAMLLVPTLPFFATHMSEFAVLASLYLVVAAIVASLFLDGERAWSLGLPLGLATSLVLASGRSALPFGAAFVAVFIGRALVGSSHHGTSAGASRRFWAGLALGLVAFPLLSTPAFREGLWPLDSSLVPDGMREPLAFLRRSPWLLVLLAPAGFACDRAMAWLRARGEFPRGPATFVLRACCAIGAAAVVVSLVLSSFVQFPSLVDLGQTRPASVVAYVGNVLSVAATGFRLWNHDRLFSVAFWGGFGWLDTRPPEWYITAVVLGHAAAGVALLLYLARRGGWQRVTWLGMNLAGWIASLALYALSLYFLGRNVHGRYLIGIYLCAIAVAWCSACLASPRVGALPPWLRAVGRDGWIAVLAAGLHAYALRVILLRYFG